MTIMQLGRKRFVLTFHVESKDDNQSIDLEALHLRKRLRHEDLTRRAWWELEHVMSRSRVF